MVPRGHCSELQVVPDPTLQLLQADKVVIHDESSTAAAAQPALRRICGLALTKTFWLVIAGPLVVMAAAIGGSIEGLPSKHNNADQDEE